MNLSVTSPPAKPIDAPDNPVYGTGMIAIHESHIMAYANQIQGSSFSCYQWSYFHSAYKTTVFKRKDVLTIHRVS